MMWESGSNLRGTGNGGIIKTEKNFISLHKVSRTVEFWRYLRVSESAETKFFVYDTPEKVMNGISRKQAWQLFLTLYMHELKSEWRKSKNNGQRLW